MFQYFSNVRERQVNMKTPKLSVCLITYNHENYIRQAIEGILMQKVDFDWELIIADDCSTDTTRAIVLEYKDKYPDFIKLIFQEKNVGPARNWMDLLSAPQSQYIAYVEGDDYWTDPLKLQKQVDFLERNSDFSSCFTDVKILKDELISSEGALKEKHKKDADSISVFYDLWIPSLTFVYRRGSLLKLPLQFEKIHNGDLFLFYLLAQKGKIKYLDFISGVYRQHSNGVWAGANKISQINKTIISLQEIKKYFKDTTEIKKILTQKIDSQKINLLKYYYKRGEKQYFFKTFFKLVFQKPLLFFNGKLYFFISK